MAKKILDKIVWVDAKVKPTFVVKRGTHQTISDALLLADKKRGVIAGFYVQHNTDRNGPFETVKAGDGFFMDVEGVKLDQVVKYCPLSSLVG